MSTIHHFLTKDGGWDWEGVPVEQLQPGVTARRFISRRDGSNQLELRYFELEPGASSHDEQHNYEHAVLVLRGRGAVLLGDEVFSVQAGDAIFVEANERHQFKATADEPFGFLCTVLDPELRVTVHGEQIRILFDEETGAPEG
jgi:quercetin dioxygenase-like cupin family protein